MSTGYPDFWFRAWMLITMYFLELKDTPGSYLAQALKTVRVNAGESGLEFTPLYTRLTDLLEKAHDSLTGVTSDQHHAELHSAAHEDGGADEISLEGLDVPHHHLTHENGGDDEIDVGGLSGLLADQQHTLIADVINAAYPVGSIFLSSVSTNPGVLFGVGTWVAWGTGRVPVGIDADQAEFATNGQTGGEKTHTTITAEMPAHTHSLLAAVAVNLTGGEFSCSVLIGAGGTGSTGGGGAHNNLQPYIVCYMWRRTA